MNSLLRERFTHNCAEHTFIGTSVCGQCKRMVSYHISIAFTLSHITQCTLTHKHITHTQTRTHTHTHTNTHTHTHTHTHKHAHTHTHTQMTGSVKQGVCCKDCGISCHKHCKDYVVVDCNEKKCELYVSRFENRGNFAQNTKFNRKLPIIPSQ